MSFLCARFFEGLGAKMENLRSCAAAKDVGTERNGNRRFTRESLIFGYIAGAFALILGSGDLSRKGEALAIFADLLLCGAGLLFISAGSKADSLTCPGPLSNAAMVQHPSAGGGKSDCLEEAEPGEAATEFCRPSDHMYDGRCLCCGNHGNTKYAGVKTGVGRDLRCGCKGICEISACRRGAAVRLEVRGSRSYEKANQNRVLVPGQNLTTCYSSFENAAYTRFRKKHRSCPLYKELSDAGRAE